MSYDPAHPDAVLGGAPAEEYGTPSSPGEHADLLAGLRSGDWLDAQEFPPLEYAVDGLVPEGFALLVGPPKAGKSWMVLSFALAAASGGYALGRIPVKPRPVLYLALEDGDRRLQDRCRTMLAGDPIPPEFEYLTDLVPGTSVATIGAWLERRATDDGALVIVDTLGRVMPPAQQGESTYQRDYRVGVALKRLADERPGTSLLVNHHDRKAGADDFVDAVSGTHGFAGAADTIVVLDRPRQESTATLKVTGRDVIEREAALTFDGQVGTWTLAGDDLDDAAAEAERRRATEGLGDRSAEVVAFVARHPDGVRSADVEAALGDDARRYLSRLADAGRIVRLQRGVYAPHTPVPSVPMSQVDGDAGTDWDNETHGTPSGGALVVGPCPRCGTDRETTAGPDTLCAACYAGGAA